MTKRRPKAVKSRTKPAKALPVVTPSGSGTSANLHQISANSSGRRSLGQELAHMFAPPDRRPIYDWARDGNVVLVPPITRTGPFDVSGSRHFIAIFDAWQHDRTREVNVLKPVRGGGSLIGDIICPWSFANDPGPYMEVFQTEPEMKLYVESRSMQIFRNSPPIRELFPRDRHKMRETEIMFNNGYTWYAVGPAISNLQTKSIRYLRLEEVWLWAQGKIGEAMGRIGDYLKMQTSKVLTISQGGPCDGFPEPMENSDWYRHYHRAQRHEWEVECPSCRKFFEPIFSGQRADGSFWGITWDRHMTPAGDWNIPKCLASIRFECEHCSHPIIDGTRTKSEFNRTGRYRAIGEPNEKRKSFHWETVIDFPWVELVELWLEACNAEKRGDLKPKLQFYQKRRAMFMDEETLLKRGIHLARSAYVMTSDWPEEKARFLTIDRQEEDMFWWTVRAWSAEKSRRLGFGKAYGFAALEKIREKFKVPPVCTFCDSRYLPKGDQGVYVACIRYGWFAVMGDKEYAFVHRLKGSRGTVLKSYAPLAYGNPDSGAHVATGRRYCGLIRFSKQQMNQKVQELIDSGAWEEPVAGEEPEMEKEYNAQMSSRVKKTEFNAKTNETKVYWREGKNDHARDLANQQVLGAILRDLLPDPATERQSRGEKAAATNS